MVKVITKGIKTVTCNKCKSKLEYSQDEVSSHAVNCDWLGDCDYVDGIECPVCKTIIKDK